MLAIPPTPTTAMSLWPARDEGQSRGCIAFPPPTSGATSSSAISINGPSIPPIALNGTSRNMAKDTSTPATDATTHPRPSRSKKASEQASPSSLSSRLGRFRLRVLARQKDLYKHMTADTSQVADGRTPPPPSAAGDRRSADDCRLGTRSERCQDMLLPGTDSAHGGRLSSSLNGRRPSWSPIGVADMVAEQQPRVASSLGPVPSLPLTSRAADRVPPSRPDVTTSSMECDRPMGLHDENSSRSSSVDDGSSVSSSERPLPTPSSSVMIRRKSRPRHRSIPADEVRGVLRRRPRYTRSASEPCMVHPKVNGPEESSNNGRRRRRSSIPFISDPPSPVPSDMTNSLGPDDIPNRGSSYSSLDYLSDGGCSDDDSEESCGDNDFDRGHANRDHLSTSYDRASSWVPLGVDFSPSMEVYVFQKDLPWR